MTLSPQFLAATLSLVAAITWGVADFSGGFASRRINTTTSAIMLNFVGALLAAAVALILRDPFPALADLGWAALAGVIGALGLIGLYEALSTGQMGIAAPVTGVLAAGLPVLVGVAVEGWPGQIQLAGFALALVGIGLASASINGHEAKIHSRPLFLAVLAGIGFGLFYVAIDRSTTSGVLWPLFIAKAASLLTLLIIAWLRKIPITVTRQLLPLLVLIGVLDVVGNVCYMFAARMGRLDVAAVLASLYPAVTALCAGLILKERLARLQAVGAVLLIVAIPLIAW